MTDLSQSNMYPGMAPPGSPQMQSPYSMPPGSYNMPTNGYPMSSPPGSYVHYDMSTGQPQQLPQQHQQPQQMPMGYPVSYPSGPIGAPMMVGGVPTGLEYDNSGAPPAYNLPPAASSIPLHTYTAQTPVDGVSGDFESESLPADYDLETDESGQLPIKPSIGTWISQGWQLYRRHWLAYSLYTVLTMLIPLLGDILMSEDASDSGEWAPFISLLYMISWPLYYGYYIAGSNEYKRIERGIREGLSPDALAQAHGRSSLLDVSDFFRVYLIFVPLWLITMLCGIFIGLGFLCFILPGIYLAVTLSFAPLLYIEYHRQTPADAARNADVVGAAEGQGQLPLTTSYSLWECVKLSRATAHRHFWHLIGLGLVLGCFTLLGWITVIGSLVTTPLVALTLVPVVRDLFELQLERAPDASFYLC